MRLAKASRVTFVNDGRRVQRATGSLLIVFMSVQGGLYIVMSTCTATTVFVVISRLTIQTNRQCTYTGYICLGGPMRLRYYYMQADGCAYRAGKSRHRGNGFV